MTQTNEPISALPDEEFEAFAERMEADKPKRRRSKPAAKPENMPEPKKKLTAADVPGIDGMVEKKWSGLQMWECPKCLATTFKEHEAKVHVCKRVKYEGEEGLED